MLSRNCESFACLCTTGRYFTSQGRLHGSVVRSAFVTVFTVVLFLQAARWQGTFATVLAAVSTLLVNAEAWKSAQVVLMTEAALALIPLQRSSFSHASRALVADLWSVLAILLLLRAWRAASKDMYLRSCVFALAAASIPVVLAIVSSRSSGYHDMGLALVTFLGLLVCTIIVKPAVALLRVMSGGYSGDPQVATRSIVMASVISLASMLFPTSAWAVILSVLSMFASASLTRLAAQALPRRPKLAANSIRIATPMIVLAAACAVAAPSGSAWAGVILTLAVAALGTATAHVLVAATIFILEAACKCTVRWFACTRPLDCPALRFHMVRMMNLVKPVATLSLSVIASQLTLSQLHLAIVDCSHGQLEASCACFVGLALSVHLFGDAVKVGYSVKTKDVALRVVGTPHSSTENGVRAPMLMANIGEAIGLAHRQFALAVIGTDRRALQFVSRALRHDRDVIMCAIAELCDAHVLQRYSAGFWSDRTSLMNLLASGPGLALGLATPALQRDRQVVLAALALDGLALAYASPVLQNDQEIVTAAIKQQGMSLGFASESMRASRSVVLQAVREDGWSLRYAAQDLQADRGVVLAAVQQAGMALRHAPTLRGDFQVASAAVKQDMHAIELVDNALKLHPEFVKLTASQGAQFMAEDEEYLDVLLDAVGGGGILDVGFARFLNRAGKYEEAAVVYRRALDRNERVLGHAHPDTLASVSNLANVLNNTGKYEEAETLHRRALDGKERVLGHAHPSTLTSVNNLASVLKNSGKHEEAETLHRRALDGRERVFGPSSR